MATYSALLALVGDHLRATEAIASTDQRARAIEAAVLRYSQDRPRRVALDLVVPAGRRVALPADFEMGLSTVVELESPPDEMPPAMVESAAVEMYLHPVDGWRWQIDPAGEYGIAVGASLRLTYVARHTFDIGANTLSIADVHLDAVAMYAAGQVCGQLATQYANESASVIATDSADHQGKTERYRARARELTAKYFDALGITPKRHVAAGVVVQTQQTDSRGNPRLFRGVQ